MRSIAVLLVVFTTARRKYIYEKQNKKIDEFLLVLCMLFSTFSLNLIVYAQDTIAPKATPTVEIVSFMRGAQKDLRSSELLEARVTGYDGNVRDLTYVWTNTLGTYLYVYNSHNMYYIDGTDGEVEIYNSKVPASTNMAGRTYKDSFEGQGYCWAAIYGSNTSGAQTSIADNNAYNGTISVKVYDGETLIGEDSHTGTVTSSGMWWWQTYSYSGIVDYSLSTDIDNVTIGLFEGDKRNVKDLLGESAIVHITCTACTVTNGAIISGDEHIILTKEGDYYIEGYKAGTSTDSNGDAQVRLSITKDYCKFHAETSGTATTTVYVFKKPTTKTTAYTLTLVDNLDARCRYFIGGREGVRNDNGTPNDPSDDTILFDGLTPNTQYMVEVRGEYKDGSGDTKYAYAYVYDTTEPIYNGKVEVYLDGTYDSTNHTASGTKVDLETVSEHSTLYAKDINSTEFVELKKVKDTVGTYSNILDAGSYKLYYTADESTKIDDQLLIMHNADRTRYLFYNSVTYKDNNTELKKEYHVTGSSVNVWSDVPKKDGYVFTGWKDKNGSIYTGADVNAFMEFEPHGFALHYAIKATTIGEGFRPSETEVLILCDDGKSGTHPQNWPVISQMIDGETKVGQDTKLSSDGNGSGSYDAWRTKPDGHSLYDYGVLLNNYTINGEETTYNANTSPFFVYYNGSARYSALEGLTPAHQTQLLTIELQPKRFTVTFDVNFTQTHEDYVTNMQNYAVQTDGNLSYLTGHTWSYETDISEVVPVREGYKFLGWYDENDNQVFKVDASVDKNITVKAKWEKAFNVIFHANNDDIGYDVFRTYYENDVDVPEGDKNFTLKADGSLDSFYDIPEYEYYTHNKYVFKGWYLDKDNDNDTRPINWNEKYAEDTDIWAHWILVEDVEKDENDTKKYDNTGKYPGYDLLGVQIRDAEKDSANHYGDEGSGLRFVTVLSNDVYNQINELSTNNINGAEYGYVIAKTATAQKYAGTTENYQLQYKGTNVNGEDTTTEYKYVQNAKCSGVPDHFGDNETAYRLYTTVITYKNLDGNALTQAYSQALVARAYIRYTDANGLYRTHYNNYTGTNTYYGCSASFDLAKSLING